MTKLINFWAFIVGSCIAATSCSNGGDHKDNNDNGNAATAVTVPTVTGGESGVVKKNVVTSDQLPFNIYCINADEVGGQSFLTSANNCWVVAGQDTKGVVSFFLTPATASAGVLTIASGSTLFQQNVTGLCPQACDIVALLGSDNPGSLTYSNPASATVNASVAAFAAQNSNSFNAYQINAGIINNIYKDNPNTTVILMYTMAENNFAVIFYQGFVFDADPGDGGLTATSKTYLDPNPVMLLKASISNP